MKVLRNARPVIVLLLVVLAIVPALPVDAGGPTRFPIPNADFDYPQNVCGFPVHVHFVANNEYAKDFGGDPDMQLITGVLIAKVSNTNTGKTVMANISGPVKLYFYADGTSRGDGAGPALFYLPDGQFPQYPRLFVGTGRIHIAWDAAGNIVAFSLDGTTRDLCAALS